MVNLMLGTKFILMKYNVKINAKQNYTHFPSNLQNSAFQYPDYEGCVMNFFFIKETEQKKLRLECSVLPEPTVHI